MTNSITPEYTVETRDERFLVRINEIVGDPVQARTDSYEENLAQAGIEFQFEQEELDFNALTERLLVLERELGKSSIELLQQYIGADHDTLNGLEDWADTFFLYLGTRDIRRFSCP